MAERGRRRGVSREPGRRLSGLIPVPAGQPADPLEDRSSRRRQRSGRRRFGRRSRRRCASQRSRSRGELAGDLRELPALDDRTRPLVPERDGNAIDFAGDSTGSSPGSTRRTDSPDERRPYFGTRKCRTSRGLSHTTLQVQSMHEDRHRLRKIQGGAKRLSSASPLETELRADRTGRRDRAAREAQRDRGSRICDLTKGPNK